MISIIIPVYNQAKTLARTLDSLAAQSDKDFEVIMVNDGSRDNPDQVFGHFYDTRQSANNYLFINQENQGAPAARNRGYKEAKGEYILFCDADASLKPDALSKLKTALEANPNMSYAYSDFYWGRKLFKPGPFSAAKLKQAPFIHTMALIRRADFPKTGWDEKIKKFQDWDLWLTMLEAGKNGVYVPEVLFTVKPGGTMSAWLPSLAYKILPFLPAVKKYQASMKIIKIKHGLQ